jgi:hypothetical protein
MGRVLVSFEELSGQFRLHLARTRPVWRATLEEGSCRVGTGQFVEQRSIIARNAVSDTASEWGKQRRARPSRLPTSEDGDGDCGK